MIFFSTQYNIVQCAPLSDARYSLKFLDLNPKIYIFGDAKKTELQFFLSNLKINLTDINFNLNNEVCILNPLGLPIKQSWDKRNWYSHYHIQHKNSTISDLLLKYKLENFNMYSQFSSSKNLERPMQFFLNKNLYNQSKNQFISENLTLIDINLVNYNKIILDGDFCLKNQIKILKHFNFYFKN